MKQIVLASSNQGKIKEFSEIFRDFGIKIISQSKFKVPEANEPYRTFFENALHKARHCSGYTDLPVLADDSGICVNALNGNPGVFSARYAGETKNSAANSKKLIEDLRSFSDKSACYYCALVLIRHPDDPQPIVADGILAGRIIDEPCGTGGFGYDPYFLLPKLGKTVAELSIQEKNIISHRAIAVQTLKNKLIEIIY